MSYRSLLFCRDEKTARLVTQVLSELEFTVELSNEPLATVKKLADEHFDAVVADIDNEQDAALLFKSARNSDLNHSSLSVAVVEGQVGVAKAFRIGANLVLTKPINIEQSKGTLRVARGLLRKSEAKSSASHAGAAAKVGPSSAPVTPFETKPPAVMAIPSQSLPPAAPAASSAEGSFSMLEVEKEPTPAPEPSEVALMESMRDPIAGKNAPVEQTWGQALKSSAEPIAASTVSSTAAAVAPALEKPVLEIKTAAPLATHEPITADAGRTESFEPAAFPVPSFTYGQESAGRGKKIFKTAAIFILWGGAGYVAWQRLQLGQYLPNMSSSSHSTESQPAKPSEETSAPTAIRSATPASQAAVPAESFPSATTPTEEPKAVSSSPNVEHIPQPENIQVEELSEPKISITPKPLVVKTKPHTSVAVQKPTPVAAPALPVSPSNSSTEVLANIVPTTATAPTPALAILRISQGVSQGLVIKKVAPVYPSSALQLRRQGSVELLATIGKDGAISGIKVLSGDATFAKAATDAVRRWKYRPYLLNGEPVQIETLITINFHLPN